MMRRAATLLLCLGSACVGLPPAPPQDETTATDDGPGTTMPGLDTGLDTGPVTTGSTDDASGSDTDDTGMLGPVCGDGLVEAPEECDLGELNGTGMYCTGECTNNVCGDGYVGPGESCDDGNPVDDDLCTTACGPTSCGDGTVQEPEQCDEGGANAETGSCLPSCVLPTCGDLFVQTGVETCDGTTIGESTCESQGYQGGVLLCAADCASFDASNCYLCGNGVIEVGETCDGDAFGAVTCQDYAPGGTTASGGALVCDAACATIDATACTYCGDAVIGGTEACEPGDLGGATCSTYLGDTYRGELACAADCTYDTTLCCVVAGNACGSNEECCSSTCSMEGLCDP